MFQSKLKITDDKMDFLLITSSGANFADNINLKLGKENITPTNSCISLGIMLNSHFTMDAQINNLSRATHFYHHNTAAIRDSHRTLPEQLIYVLKQYKVGVNCIFQRFSRHLFKVGIKSKNYRMCKSEENMLNCFERLQ